MTIRVGILRYVLTVFAIWASTLVVSGQEIRTSAPEEILGQETFKIEYQVISLTPIDELPSLVAAKDFELLDEPELSKTYPSSFWGDRYHTLKISCLFRAKRIGKLDLPRIEWVVEGQKMVSKKGTILVRELPQIGNVQCFVKVDVSKKQVNVGDTLSVSYKLYTTKEISNLLSINTPGLQGFQYQDITPRNAGYVEEKVDGVVYKVYVIRKYLLQARSLGRKELGNGSAEVEYTYPTGRVRTDARGRGYEEQLRETKSCSIEEAPVLVHDMVTV